MLHNLQIAQLEYQERIRDFNVRAARGEFIWYPENAQPSLSERLAKFARAIRNRLSRQEAPGLVVRPGVDSA